MKWLLELRHNPYALIALYCIAMLTLTIAIVIGPLPLSEVIKALRR